jgi:hypothetical protein
MKYIKSAILLFSFFILPALSAQQNDMPYWSEDPMAPPPPPPGFAEPVDEIAPDDDYMPAPPVLPAPNTPPSAQFRQRFAPVNMPKAKKVQAISRDLYLKLKKVMRSVGTFRTVVNKPENGPHLRRLQMLVEYSTNLLGLADFPPMSRFSPSYSDKVIRDRSYGAVEYRHFGDFDQRLNGWIKPIKTAIYLDLNFTGRGKRRTHIKAQVSRSGTLEGHFYAYGWDKYSNCWQIQGKIENMLCYDNALPYTGNLHISGTDPNGKAVALNLNFPVKVVGNAIPEQKEIRHRRGEPVHIGN